MYVSAWRETSAAPARQRTAPTRADSCQKGLLLPLSQGLRCSTRPDSPQLDFSTHDIKSQSLAGGGAGRRRLGTEGACAGNQLASLRGNLRMRSRKATQPAGEEQAAAERRVRACEGGVPPEQSNDAQAHLDAPEQSRRSRQGTRPAELGTESGARLRLRGASGRRALTKSCQRQAC